MGFFSGHGETFLYFRIHGLEVAASFSRAQQYEPDGNGKFFLVTDDYPLGVWFEFCIRKTGLKKLCFKRIFPAPGVWLSKEGPDSSYDCHQSLRSTIKQIGKSTNHKDISLWRDSELIFLRGSKIYLPQCTTNDLLKPLWIYPLGLIIKPFLAVRTLPLCWPLLSISE